MPTFADAALVARPVMIQNAIRVSFNNWDAAASLPTTGRLPNMLLDVLKAAFLGTNVSPTNNPALRVHFVTPEDSGSAGPGRMPADLETCLRSAFDASNVAISDGAPALRVQFV